MIGDGLALADVVRFRRIDILHDVVEEPPLPHHVALHVHFDDGVHLAVAIRALRRVGAGGDRLLARDGLVGDVEGGWRPELPVEDAHPVVMRRVACTLLVYSQTVLPSQSTSLKPAKPLGSSLEASST